MGRDVCGVASREVGQKLAFGRRGVVRGGDQMRRELDRVAVKQGHASAWAASWL